MARTWSARTGSVGACAAATAWAGTAGGAGRRDRRRVDRGLLGGRSLGDGGGVVVAGRRGCRSGLVGGGGGRGLRSDCGDLLAALSGVVVGRRHASPLEAGAAGAASSATAA